MKIPDSEIIGKRYGRLVIVSKKKKVKYAKTRTALVVECICDCGNIFKTKLRYIRSGKTNSCGCFKKEQLRKYWNTKKERTKKIKSIIKKYKKLLKKFFQYRKKHFIKKHGMSGTPEYRRWTSIKYRCYNKNCRKYNMYGGRGIKMCDEWLNSFEKFRKDMGCRPSAKHSIDRIDNNGDYTPENCRWATPKEQARNKRDTVYISFKGETLPLVEWAERKNISPSNIRYKYSKGLSIEEIFKK
jgi:hypothetical protein